MSLGLITPIRYNQNIRREQARVYKLRSGRTKKSYLIKEKANKNRDRYNRREHMLLFLTYESRPIANARPLKSQNIVKAVFMLVKNF